MTERYLIAEGWRIVFASCKCCGKSWIGAVDPDRIVFVPSVGWSALLECPACETVSWRQIFLRVMDKPEQKVPRCPVCNCKLTLESDYDQATGERAQPDWWECPNCEFREINYGQFDVK